jgi:pectate lyase
MKLAAHLRRRVQQASVVVDLKPVLIVVLGAGLACSATEEPAPGSDGSSGGTAGAPMTGGAGQGGSAAGSSGSGTSGFVGSAGSGGQTSQAGSTGSGGRSGSGGAQQGDKGGSTTGGGASGGGSGGTVDADGCPITQEGFSTVNTLGQNGTTGGLGGEVVTVTSQADLEKYAGASQPYVIRVQGKITISPKGKEVKVASDKTLIGLGGGGEISQGGFFLGSGTHNVIIRNLTIGGTFVEGDWDGKQQDFDGIQMDTAHHVWIDHVELHHGGDGLIDSRKDTTNLTVSWTILRDHNKAFGIGWTENVSAEMTIHHNIFRDTGTRNPSTDNVLRAHLFNNWLLRTDSYGNYSRGGTNMVLENSVFEQVANPHYYDTGSLVAVGNTYSGASGQKESSGSSYSFFDPSDFYEYELHPASEVKKLLTDCAGPRATLGR